MKKNTVVIIALAAAIVLVIAGFILLNLNRSARSESIVSECRAALDKVASEAKKEVAAKEKEKAEKEKAAREKKKKEQKNSLSALEEKMSLEKDFKDEFVHGEKGKEFQKYIVLHDTEGGGSPADVISGWQNQGKKIAAHFVVGKDGTVVQCVPMDKIAHHAGFGDRGHNEKYGVSDESRDDKIGTEPIGDDYPDYGMNSWSIGIEMVHNGSSGEEYPAAQLEALDNLVAYIDTYYGTKSKIIDHKAWRTTNSDTSPEFAGYFENYKDHRTHD
jgi:hypothetical protein